MTHDQLSKDIKKGAILRAYLFYGPEVYVRDRAISALKSKLLPPGFEALNMTRMEGDVSLSDLSQAAQTMPMMGEKRLIILRDWLPLTGKEQADDSGLERFAQSIPDSCCLVILGGDSLDKRKKFVQTLMKCVEPVEFPLMQGSDLHRYCGAHIAPKQIAFDALEQLIFAVGRSMTALASELDKLCAYVGERQEITLADVEAISSRSPESEVFKMIDLLMTGSMAKAQALLKDLLENGEKPAGVIALLIRQLRMLTHIRLMRDQGITLSEIEQKLSLTHYVASRAATQAARYSADVLEQGYRACVMADYRFKSGQAREEAALDELILRLGQMRRIS